MTATPKPATLWAALSAAREEIAPFVKDADNPFFHSKYVALDTILASVLPTLRKHGLYAFGRAVASPEAGTVSVLLDKNGLGYVSETARGGFVTTVVHVETGEMVEDVRPFVGVQTAQNMGAASSYSFRYGLAALLALELTDEDDDGNKAAGLGQGRPAQAAATRPATRPQAAQGTAKQGGAAPRPHDPKACPKCGAVGYIRQQKSGKDVGLWKCFHWPEKNMHGCNAKWTYDPLGTSEQALANQPMPSEREPVQWKSGTGLESKDAHARFPEDDPPPPLDPDALPF